MNFPEGKSEWADDVFEALEEAFQSDPYIGIAIRADLTAVQERDSATASIATPFLATIAKSIASQF